jgi:hypothetical protein
MRNRSSLPSCPFSGSWFPPGHAPKPDCFILLSLMMSLLYKLPVTWHLLGAVPVIGPHRHADITAMCLYGCHVIFQVVVQMSCVCTYVNSAVWYATSTATSSCHIILPCHFPRHRTVCHVAIWIAMWHIFTGPQHDIKMPKMSDMWQPLVLPRHHADINMTHVTSCVCHIC